jgi:hypothetical protein
MGLVLSIMLIMTLGEVMSVGVVIPLKEVMSLRVVTPLGVVMCGDHKFHLYCKVNLISIRIH